MRVLVDTSVWSLALRRRPTDLHPSERRIVAEWEELVREGRVLLVGLVRQELLSGVAQRRAYETLRDAMRAFPDEPLETEDHEEAAECFNLCRARGITGTAVDMLLCAVARRRPAAMFTTDTDYGPHARILGLTLHVPR